MRSFTSSKVCLVAIFIVIMAGCQQLPRETGSTALLFKLMPIPSSLVNKGWLESFYFSGVVEQSMMVSTEFSSSDINLVALTPEGMPIAQLQFNTASGAVNSNSPLTVAFDAQKIIYDMQSAFWPLTMLKKAAFADIVITEQTKNGQLSRLFYRNNALIREITYNGALTQLIEYEQDYRLKIQRLEEY